MNQWSGINSLAYFLPITFERNIGLPTGPSLIISGILGLQYFFVSWLCVPPRYDRPLSKIADAYADHISLLSDSGAAKC